MPGVESAMKASYRPLSVFVLLSLAGSSTSSIAAEVNKPGSSAPLFQIKEGQVVLPAYDHRQLTATTSSLVLNPTDFLKPAHVYAERLILDGDAPVVTKQFLMPSAVEMAILARGNDADEIFPRISIEVGSAGNWREMLSGFIASRSLKEFHVPIQRDLIGKPAQLRMRILNPSSLEEHRAVYLSSITFRSLLSAGEPTELPKKLPARSPD